MTRKSDRVSRGYFGIGIERSKTEANVGTLWRSAFSLGASFVFTIGKRYPRQSSDTTEAWRHIPLLEYSDVADLHQHIPYDCQVVGVEITDDAEPLEAFVHPHRAIYLLGPEDGSLSKAALDICQHVVRFSSAYCLNVAAAGTVVMYDRQAKRMKGGLMPRRGIDLTEDQWRLVKSHAAKRGQTISEFFADVLGDLGMDGHVRPATVANAPATAAPFRPAPKPGKK